MWVGDKGDKALLGVLDAVSAQYNIIITLPEALMQGFIEFEGQSLSGFFCLVEKPTAVE